MRFNFYQYPNLYFALRSPAPAHYQAVREIMEKHLDGPLTSVMDPACGPATWLLPFARDGLKVAGNDLYTEMVDWAHRTLDGFDREIVEGDMCDLRFATGPFDAAFEVSGTCGHLPDDEALLKHWQTVLSHVRPGGLYVQHLFFDDGPDAPALPHVSHQSPLTPVPSGGMGSITYEIVSRDVPRRMDLMRRTIRAVDVPDCPPEFVDEYELRYYSASNLRPVLDRLVGSTLVALYDVDETGARPLDLDSACSEAVLVFRRS